MDGLTKRMFKFFITITTGIILGMILGVLSLNTLVSHRIDEYFKEITYLESIIEDRDNKLKKLEESINNQKYILKSVEVILEYDGDDIDKVTLEKAIKEKYNNLIGKEVASIDIDMVGEVVDKRIMKLDDDEYKLSVNKILLSEILKVWVEANQIDEKPEE